MPGAPEWKKLHRRILFITDFYLEDLPAGVVNYVRLPGGG